MKLNGKKMLLCSGICILAMSSYTLSSYATTTTETETRQEQPPQDFGTMGKITAVDDNTITVVLTDMPKKPNGNSDGTTPPEKPADESTPPEKPAGDGTEASTDGKKAEMNFTGETKTYTIPSSASITKGMEQESASISDLAADTVIRITLDGETVTGINILK